MKFEIHKLIYDHYYVFKLFASNERIFGIFPAKGMNECAEAGERLCLDWPRGLNWNLEADAVGMKRVVENSYLKFLWSRDFNNFQKYFAKLLL